MKAVDVVDILTENDGLERRLLDFCEELKFSEQHDEEQGFSYWPHEEGNLECFYCTSAAKLVAREFQGKVVGYSFEDSTSRPKVATDSEGHDFAVVGDYIVDYWAWAFEESIPKPVLSRTRDAALIAENYLPTKFWKVVKDYTA